MLTNTWVWCSKCKYTYNSRFGHTSAHTCPEVRSGGRPARRVQIPWARIRAFHPQLPPEPVPGKRYTLSLWLWCPACSRCFDIPVHGPRCPYRGCLGRDRDDYLLWRHVRAAHPSYPVEPTYAQAYWHKPGQKAWRRTKIGERTYKAERAVPSDKEVVCISCETINPAARPRCFYCDKSLPGTRPPGRNLSSDLHWSHWSNHPQVINETLDPNEL